MQSVGNYWSDRNSVVLLQATEMQLELEFEETSGIAFYIIWASSESDEYVCIALVFYAIACQQQRLLIGG